MKTTTLTDWGQSVQQRHKHCISKQWLFATTMCTKLPSFTQQCAGNNGCSLNIVLANGGRLVHIVYSSKRHLSYVIDTDTITVTDTDKDKDAVTDTAGS